MSRRRFLQAAGLGAGSLFLPSLTDRRARAAPGDPPMRLVICYTEHGVVHDNWKMQFANPPNTRWEYNLGALTADEFSASLQPLHRHRNKLTIVDGLAMATAISDPYGDGHAKGYVSSLTGGIARETVEGIDSNAAKPSLDRIVGDALRAQDPTLTDLANMDFGVYKFSGHAPLWSSSGNGGPVQRVPHDEQPRSSLDRLFPNGDGSMPDPRKLAQPDVLASVGGMYDRMAQRLSAEDRRKIEQHRNLVRDMESRLRLLNGLTCGRPTIEDYRFGEVPYIQRYNAHTQSFWDLTAVALSCGITRVVTMQFGGLQAEMLGATGDLHQDFAHPSAPNQINNPQHAVAVQRMTEYTAYYASRIAELADQLDAIPEANGTLLDNTIILWVSEISNGGHGHDNWPVVLIGGGQSIRTGRYLHYERDTLTTTRASYEDENGLIGYPHNHLLVSVARAIGVDTDTVGDTSVQPKKAGAAAIDLRGPLPGLI